MSHAKLQQDGGSVDVVEAIRKSKEIPRVYHEVRQSLDIQRTMQQQEPEPVPSKKAPKKAAKKQKMGNISYTEHSMNALELLNSLNVTVDPESGDPKGLTSELAKQRLELNGKNVLIPPKQTPVIIKFIREFTNLFSLLLILAGALSLLSLIVDQSSIITTIVLAVVLWIVVIVNGIISFHENQKTEKIVQGFKKMATPTCMCIRDGILNEIDASTLVVGDIVQVQGGDRIPADIRLIKCNKLKVDNSSLTGESDPITLGTEMTNENPLETKNLAFFGTMALEGQATGVVIRTSNNTCIGQIASLASSTKTTETPLRREINLIVYIISVIAITMALVFFIYGCFRVYFVTSFIYAVGLIVANIPQGLMATVTLVLTLSCKRLARKRLLVKNLEAVEILGSTTCICSDKTGTLTQGRMTVISTWTNDTMNTVTYEKPGDVFVPKNVKQMTYNQDLNDATAQLIEGCALCSKTTYANADGNLDLPIIKRKCHGDASEVALLKFFDTRTDTFPSEVLRKMFPIVFQIVFNSTNKWAMTIHKNAEKPTDPRVLRIKGAPERILAMCSYILIDGKTYDINEFKDKFQQAYESMAAGGQRVLGHARLILDPVQFPPEFDNQYTEENVVKTGYTFLGLTGLMDPPKPGVPESVALCHQAGIQVVMVTGDHSLTAKAIAKQVNIIKGETREDIAEREGCKVEDIDEDRATAIVIEGSRLESFTKYDWEIVLSKKEIVFARTSPQQKLLIVSKFQEKGHTVSVTGDGVNDSPALKKADLGIAMGSGSEVSKEAASMVVLDDNFASIVEGVKEGRLIFDNIKKSIAYTVTHLLPEVIPVVVYFIFNIPLPLTSLLILFVDLGTEFISATSLVYEPQERDIMKRKPREKDEAMFSLNLFSFSYLQIGIIETLGALFAYFMVFANHGIPPNALVNSTLYYFSHNSPDLVISPTLKYTAAQQMEIVQLAQSVYFVIMANLQSFNLIGCRSRRNSFVQQGIFTNLTIYIGVFCCAAITCFIVYVPGVNTILGTRPIPAEYWLCLIPFGLFIVVYDEVRKFFVRATVEEGQYKPFDW